MDKIAIQSHNFEEAKNNLKAFSEEANTDLELEHVESKGGLFKLGNHQVTGTELNNSLSQIQKHLINLNSFDSKMIKEVGEIYNALEALDKDYIQIMLMEMEGIKKANNGVKRAQSDIKKTMKIQEKTIDVLTQFKEKLASYKHLDDIDKLWAESLDMREEISSLTNAIKSITEPAENQFQIPEKPNDDIYEALSRKLKLAYILAGGSIGVVIIEFILHILRVL